ncbi:protein takeout-like [Leptidea sinapis]|uniref:protein takeout-like n=1 Tax=Leptidea sinapis TaxID=189913 RepID=UPI0021410E11|nr:protein takeout-like [Leptidea sinapis]
MFRERNIFIGCLIVLCSGNCFAKVSPDYIKPCPGLKSECLVKNVQETIPLFVKGIPSLGINSTDPLYSDRVDLELPGGLKINFRDGVVTGFKKCVIESASYNDLDAQLAFRCNITIKGKYTAAGRVLIVQINGDGDAKIKSPNIHLNAKLKFEDVTRDGVVYRTVKDYKVDYKFLDRVSFVFTNLFKGEPALSETVLKFLNENWKQVVDEFGKPVVETIIRLTFDNIKTFFKSIPKEELIVE